MASFYRGFEWRFFFTDLHSVITTWATDLQKDRTLLFALGQSATIDMAIKADDFRVNGIWTDGYPRVAQSNRLIYGLRREGGGTPWRCRAAGITMTPNDEGDSDIATTHLVAYDARKLLEARPATNADGSLPGPDGFRLLDGGGGFATGAVIGLTMLKNTILSPLGGPVRIDAGVAWGGTAFWGGTIDADALAPDQALDLTITQGQSVADIWDAVEQTQNCDFILRPIYDPVNRPGYTHELSVYRLAGATRHNVVFAWDRLQRNVSHISRLHDATPGSFFNTVQYFAGQGGPPVPATAPLDNTPSITAFGRYWSQQFFPSLQSSVSPAATVLALARQALVMVKQGKRTITINTITERAKVPLRDYEIGDRVVVRASKRLRVTSDGLQRVESIPINVTDDGVENCVGLVTTPDYLNLTPDAPGQAKLSTVDFRSADARRDVPPTRQPQVITP